MDEMHPSSIDLSEWGLEAVGVDASAELSGSPERALSRCVVADRSGDRWVLEQIDPANRPRKQAVAEQMEQLCGLEAVHPYRRTRTGSFFSEDRMLRPYLDGTPLRRPGWLDDAWRLDGMGRFLIQLREQTAGWSGPYFSIAAYAAGRMTAWRNEKPGAAARLERVFQTLEKTFFPVHNSLPHAFCHGDYHPLNMVWGKSSIRSVIDWEFCGMKPELYDVALLTGCIGFEEPDNLIHEPVIRLLRTLREAGFSSEESWSCFLELVAAIRFGWMSEWIRRRDREAIQMEAVYLDILVDQRDYILERMF